MVHLEPHGYWIVSPLRIGLWDPLPSWVISLHGTMGRRWVNLGLPRGPDLGFFGGFCAADACTTWQGGVGFKPKLIKGWVGRVVGR